jgi:DNA-binding transcriptional regulator YhcF (GntR family)
MAKEQIKWFLDKENKIPLYLQIKDLIKYYISTGVILDNTVLPGVNMLAKELNINFETVRKAYKELEKEGFLSMSRGKRTCVTLTKGMSTKVGPAVPIERAPEEDLKASVRRFLKSGNTADDAKKIVSAISKDIANEKTRKFLLFAECNLLQANEISELLKTTLTLPVKPVLVSELSKALHDMAGEMDRLLAIVTTGFHVNEVRSILGGKDVDVQVLITNMSPETRQALLKFGSDAKVGFVCRDKESIPFYKDVLRAELGEGVKLTPSVIDDKAKIQEIVHTVDVCLATPPTFKDFKRMVPPDFPVYNVFDRVDPMSLRLVKDRILAAI